MSWLLFFRKFVLFLLKQIYFERKCNSPATSWYMYHGYCYLQGSQLEGWCFFLKKSWGVLETHWYWPEVFFFFFFIDIIIKIIKDVKLWFGIVSKCHAHTVQCTHLRVSENEHGGRRTVLGAREGPTDTPAPAATPQSGHVPGALCAFSALVCKMEATKCRDGV